jgi:photosystem II stability/assembly factor-like uncharacterized protein
MKPPVRCHPERSRGIRRCLSSLPALASITILALFTSGAAHAQWQIQTSNTTADLRGIHNVGNGVAWASGTNGTVLRTEDGGYVWQTCAIPPGAEKLDFRGIQAFDANTAIVMSSGKGDLSRLYKTTDGCHTWKLIFANPYAPDGFFDAIQAQGHDLFWILGDPVDGRFVITYPGPHLGDWALPGGKHTQQTLTAPQGSGAFAASNSSLFLARDALKRNEPSPHPRAWFGTSGPGGASIYYLISNFEEGSWDNVVAEWHRASVPLSGGSGSSGVFSLEFSKTGIGVAVGGDYTKPAERAGTAAYSTDEGKTWAAAKTMPYGYRSATAHLSKRTWITVGPNGTDISTDDGKNWRAIHPSAALHEPPDADRNWNAISLPYVVGPKGRIGKLDESAIK